MRQHVLTTPALLVCLASLAGAAAVLPAAEAGTVSAAAEDHFPTKAEAPCRESADISLRLSYDEERNYPERITVRVRDAESNRRWSAQVAVYSGDDGSVLVTDQRTGDDGRWVLRASAAAGQVEIDVIARQDKGRERCAVSLTGRVSRLP